MSAAAAPLDPEYLAGIREGLDRAFEQAGEEALDPARDRIAVFSDHHKGAGDRADDFRNCEHAYTAALGFYLEAGYRLFVLGDAEELWEEPAGDVLERYREVLELEADFARRGGLVRFWGNHDDEWSSKRSVRRHLRGVFGDIEVREGLRLRVERSGTRHVTLFFVHGHQGTAESDRWGWLARLPVRHLWRRVQRWTGWSATTPARDHSLRARHDRAMFQWARERGPGVVLVAGHTHRPVFAGSLPDPPPARPIPDLEEALASAPDAEAAAAIRAELEYALTARRRPDQAISVSPPCYFNTGCCSFPDGDITGLEIADGEIRLVRWPANLRELVGGAGVEPGSRVLASERLDLVLDAVSESRPAASAIVEHAIAPDDARGS